MSHFLIVSFQSLLAARWPYKRLTSCATFARNLSYLAASSSTSDPDLGPSFCRFVRYEYYVRLAAYCSNKEKFTLDCTCSSSSISSSRSSDSESPSSSPSNAEPLALETSRSEVCTDSEVVALGLEAKKSLIVCAASFLAPLRVLMVASRGSSPAAFHVGFRLRWARRLPATTAAGLRDRDFRLEPI